MEKSRNLFGTSVRYTVVREFLRPSTLERALDRLWLTKMQVMLKYNISGRHIVLIDICW